MIAAVLAAVTAESHAVLFRDPAMARVVRLAEQVAPSEAGIGTGKEVIARYIHRKSRRAEKKRTFREDIYF
ncbi:MAG: two component sigma54 specific Fis family transcriptional regulator [Rhodospirillaceae bacterium]|nr:MAG: two component sigma54 specific Fis family transcriptional regulator [Rhodospirillaceae bacterium]